MNEPVSIARVRPVRGWQWLGSANRLFSRARGYWLLLILAYWVITLMLSVIPWVGVALATLLKPVFAVGFLSAAWAMDRGELPRFARLFDGFRSNIAALLPLGAAYGLGIGAALAISSLMDGGVLMRLALFGVQPAGDMMTAQGMRSAMLLAGLCAVPTLFALWFSPALIVFQDQPAFRALSISLRAAVSNPGAVIVYALSIFFFWVIVPGAIIGIGAMFGKNGLLLGVILATPVTLAVVAIIHVADYVIYRDLFHHGEAITPSRE